MPECHAVHLYAATLDPFMRYTGTTDDIAKSTPWCRHVNAYCDKGVLLGRFTVSGNLIQPQMLELRIAAGCSIS